MLSRAGSSDVGLSLSKRRRCVLCFGWLPKAASRFAHDENFLSQRASGTTRRRNSRRAKRASQNKGNVESSKNP